MEILNTLILAHHIPTRSIIGLLVIFGVCLLLVSPIIWLLTYKPKNGAKGAYGIGVPPPFLF